MAQPLNRRSAASKSAPSTALLALDAAGSARTTMSAPGGSAVNRCRKRWRSRRCTRWRTTAPPSARPTISPTLAGTAGAAPGGGQARWTTRDPAAARRPRCTAVAKSRRRVKRVAAGSTGNVRGHQRDQADSSVRPLRRRAAMMARPARVRMRTRNP